MSISKNSNRVIAVSKIGTTDSKADVQIMPADNVTYWTKVPWTVDSGMPKTMLA